MPSPSTVLVKLMTKRLGATGKEPALARRSRLLAKRAGVSRRNPALSGQRRSRLWPAFAGFLPWRPKEAGFAG